MQSHPNSKDVNFVLTKSETTHIEPFHVCAGFQTQEACLYYHHAKVRLLQTDMVLSVALRKSALNRIVCLTPGRAVAVKCAVHLNCPLRQKNGLVLSSRRERT